jgi:hypothetical protein
MDSAMRKSNRITEEDCSDFSRRNKNSMTYMYGIDFASISESADLLSELSVEHRGDVC